MPDPRLSAAKLYAFLDTAYLAGRDPGKVAGQLIAGGADLLQVRAKRETQTQRTELSRIAVHAARGTSCLVIVNDDIQAAQESGADGVHLGQEDWDTAGRTRPAGVKILGISTHSLEQAVQAERDGADYIGVGPIFPTGTKPGVKPVGLELVREVTGKVRIPFFAIGGITQQNLADVQQAGATRVAVVSAILCAEDVVSTAASFKMQLKKGILS